MCIYFQGPNGLTHIEATLFCQQLEREGVTVIPVSMLISIKKFNINQSTKPSLQCLLYTTADL